MKKLLSFLIASLLPMVANAYDFKVANADGVTIYYRYINNGTELEVTGVGSNSYRGDVVIPEEVTFMNRTRKVTKIGTKAFYDCSRLTSVTIGNSVTIIGSEAFDSCKGLTSVTIPNSVTSIGERAFSGCSGLTSVKIPNSVTIIGSEAFVSCSGLTSVNIGNSVKTIGELTFAGCSRLTSVKIPNSVTSIGDQAFWFCSGLTSVTIGNSVTSIGSYAFQGCSSLTSVTIGNSVTSIGHWAFEECYRLTSVHITDLAAWCNISFADVESNPLSFANHLFLNGEEIKDLVIPNSVTSIGDYAFFWCSGLTSVTIPSSVTSIGIRAFHEVDIPTVISLIEEPLAIDWPFSGNTYMNATLYVPEGTIDKYKATEGWKEFVFIEEGNPTGVERIKAGQEGTVSYYSLGGQRLAQPRKGLVIKKTADGKSRKVMVK